MLVVEGLAKRLGGRLVFDRVSFTLESGQLLIITGPNGAGKSTLLRILAGASRPHAGRILLDGQPLQRARPELRARLGYLGHEAFLYPDLTARENLRFWARVYAGDRGPGRPAAAGAGRPPVLQEATPGDPIGQLLSAWGLAAAADRPVRTFSRGMRQRLGLARALLHRPRLLLLDEPLTGLDDDGRRRLGAALDQHLEGGGAAIVTTHEDLPEPAGGRRARRARLESGRLTLL